MIQNHNSSPQANILITIWLLVLALFTPFSGFAAELDINQLQRNHDVEITAWIGTQGDSRIPQVSVNQQVILNIEVATSRWFTGGTRIGAIDVANLIAKQRNQLATNFSDRKGEQTWSRQRWEVTLYPQASGSFVIPPVPVWVKVSVPDGSNVAGTLYTPPLRFEAALPTGMVSDQTPWFVASNVEIEQQWQTSHEQLKVGDAITRTVTVSAQDSLSVLLPNLLSDLSTQQYHTYPQPHQLSDTQTRGDYQSTRTEQSVYVIQQGGDITLPDIEFHWWNSKSNQLETVVVQGQSFHAKHTLASFLKAYSSWLIAACILLTLLVSAIIAIKRYYRKRPVPAWLTFRRLVRAKRWGAVRTLLYRQARTHTSQLEMAKVDNSEQWQQISARIQAGEQNSRLIKQGWRKVRTTKLPVWRMKLPRALKRLDT
ncbi:BatD family protein [Photobacterium sp.]|uniref:BatD family protein n=1 Tax=Photobacterium sp. TaxID=660 RepID=UPI00299E0B3C|nr:BatD family protein [Photobacterium sp.]MDX1303251.1 BatD family protein [Photobacterium sp.]